MKQSKLFVLTLLLIFSLLLSCDPDEVNLKESSEKMPSVDESTDVGGPMGPPLSGTLGANNDDAFENSIIFYANDKDNFSTTKVDHLLAAFKRDGTPIDLKWY